MNKFKILASKLLKGSLWCSQIEYIVMQQVQTQLGMPVKFVQKQIIKLLVTISTVNKNLVDQNVLATDSVIVLPNETVVPKIEDIIRINGVKYNIVTIVPIANLNNQPACYQLVVRIK